MSTNQRPPPNGITPREVQVLLHLARGRSKPQVAKILGISAHTANRHTTNLMGKAGVHSRAELVRWAIRNGVMEA